MSPSPVEDTHVVLNCLKAGWADGLDLAPDCLKQRLAAYASRKALDAEVETVAPPCEVLLARAVLELLDHEILGRVDGLSGIASTSSLSGSDIPRNLPSC